MKKLIALLSLLAVVIPAVPEPAAALPERTTVKLYQGGLDFAIDMAWVPGTKRVFFTEKGGDIHMMKGGRLLSQPCATLPVNDDGERGALGIALHPRYKQNHRLYVYYTNASPIENRVARFVVDRNRCTNKKDIIRGIHASSATNHNGGQLEFVKGKLFVSVGENADPSRSQDKSDRLGKILRYNPNGTIPTGNPFDNAVWSYGLRNPFGLAHKPGTSKIYSTENGPSCDDELNFIRRGRNYGWGDGYSCGTAGVGPNPKAPIKRWSDIIVPTDPTWYRGRMKSLSGDLYVGDFQGRLHRMVMNAKANQVKADRIIHNAGEGIVDVAKGPGGWLYYLTPGGIYKIVPAN